ncbi:hypothetical protein WOLCODRAFT_147561 [Wolfiporia cocos MD-104 SS10]|uniref:Uncharacterized protein n=1 Tax=Wolfiporia cocos (strain MD-104) TaxID=742152 RepID=A0A2H3IU06_WOLCO|nr:hypothetical protein WOLCODRAFT_147561 [Wolfiporia cocos MD-104 SS10]
MQAIPVDAFDLHVASLENGICRAADTGPLHQHEESAPYFTLTPLGGWPEIHGDHSMYLFAGILANQVRAWRAHPGDKVLVQMFCRSTCDPSSVAYAGFVCWVVQYILQTDDVDIAMPNVPTVASDINHPPFSFLLHNLPPSNLMWVMPNYIGSLAGFGSGRMDALEAIVHQHLRSDPAANFIQTVSRGHSTLSRVPETSIVKCVLETVWIVILPTKSEGGIPEITYNLYIQSPTEIPGEFEQWREIVL